MHKDSRQPCNVDEGQLICPGLFVTSVSLLSNGTVIEGKMSHGCRGNRARVWSMIGHRFQMKGTGGFFQKALSHLSEISIFQRDLEETLHLETLKEILSQIE